MTPISSLPSKPPRTVAICGGKGGVGKSTVAVNLAVAYSVGHRVLLVDGDFGMADANLMLGLAPSRSVSEVLAGVPIEQVLAEAYGFHLLPGLNGSYRLANLETEARQAIIAAIESLSDQFDTLILDTQGGISANSVELAAKASSVVVVATPEPLSLADAYATLKVLATQGGVREAFLLPNGVRSPSEGEEVVSRLTALVDRFVGIQLTPLPFIPFDSSVAVAATVGVPLIVHAPESPASQAIQRMARQLRLKASPPTTNQLWS